jgi:hypothetical protein
MANPALFAPGSLAKPELRKGPGRLNNYTIKLLNHYKGIF